MKNLLILGISFLILLANCRNSEQVNRNTIETDKTFVNEKSVSNNPASFTLKDFVNVKETTKINHLDGANINDSVAHADAASAACETLNNQVFFFPEEYYEKNKGKIIPSGNVIKLSPKDSFILLKADKIPSESVNITDFKELAHIELNRKQEIYNSLVKLKFTEADLVRVIDYLSENKKSFKLENEKEITLDTLYFAAASGYLSSIDPYSTIIKADFSEKKINKETSLENLNQVSGKLLENHGFIYIKINSFYRNENEDSVIVLKNTFKILEEEANTKQIKLKGLILDLRDNTGGYLDLAVDTADQFIPNGLILKTVSSNKQIKNFNANIPDLTDLPLAILVNSKTGSGSELVAGSLQYYKRGIILGDQTFGNGSVQKITGLPENDKFFLKITYSRYFLPSGDTTQVIGVLPDISISSEEDGSFPPSLREEDKWKHLPPIKSLQNRKSKLNIDKIKEWIRDNGAAARKISENKKLSINSDYFLLRAIDAFNGYISIHQNKK